LKYLTFKLELFLSNERVVNFLTIRQAVPAITLLAALYVHAG